MEESTLKPREDETTHNNAPQSAENIETSRGFNVDSSEVINDKANKALDSKDFKYQNLKREEPKETKEPKENNVNYKALSILTILLLVIFYIFTRKKRKTQENNKSNPLKSNTSVDSSADSSVTNLII